MKTEFEVMRTSREVYAKYFEYYSLEQLNKVPQGFSNNLIWNIGHIVVSQQMLVYGGSGLAMHVSGELINKYMRGTRPEGDITQQEAEEIKGLLFWTIEKTAEDYNAGLFTAYTERKTQMGFVLKTVEDAIAFNNYHEGLHLGIIMSIRKFV